MPMKYGMFDHRLPVFVGWFMIVISCAALPIVVPNERAMAINITVDYRYDTGNFFNTTQKRATIEAAAARYSAIITTSLSAVTLSDNTIDPRISFYKPGNPTSSFEVSSAVSRSTDALANLGGTAGEYRGPWSIAADQWILYVGGGSLSGSAAAQGGTGTGYNLPSVYSSGSSHLNRGFRAFGSTNNLPVWGGAITFDNDGSTAWHYDLNTAGVGATADLYSIALHEIGHTLGLSYTWLEWSIFSSGNHFSGPKALAAYNADNGTSRTSLNEVGGTDHHWQDGVYDSFIFPNGNPNYVGTVGPGVPQDLLMEPISNYTQTVHRFELTNVEVAALRDLGWSVITSQVSGDINGDGLFDARDYPLWRKSNGTQAQYAAWRASFRPLGGSGTSDGAFAGSIPEPTTWLMMTAAVAIVSCWIRRFS